MTRARRDRWNRCDECGRFISFMAFESGEATRALIDPETEQYKTLCAYHNPNYSDGFNSNDRVLLA